MLEIQSRRQFLATSAGTIGGLATIMGGAAATGTVTLEGAILSSEQEPVSDALVAVVSDSFEYVRTDSDGHFSVQVPPRSRVSLGFYKSNPDEFLAPRLDGVPHIFTLPKVTVGSNGVDLGRYELPDAFTLDAKAVFANKPGGVANAIPRFGSVRDGSWFASGYSFTTTNEDGYMKLIDADFTGVEMAGTTRLWMYPPTYEPYEEQSSGDYAPYEKVDITTVDISEDTTIESDISRRRENVGKGSNK